jgi:plastocyanin
MSRAAEGALPAEGAAAAGGGGTVKMAGLAFAPGNAHGGQGHDGGLRQRRHHPHTVTARSGGVDSGVLDPGKQFSLTVTEGFDYFCSIHPSMTAKIAVTG